MNFQMLFQLFMMMMSLGTKLEGLQAGQKLDSLEEMVPPVYLTWRDGRKFEMGLVVKRTA